MNENATRKSCKINVAFVLTLVLIIAKVWGGVSISWLFCFAPLFISWGIALAFMLFIIWANYRSGLL